MVYHGVDAYAALVGYLLGRHVLFEESQRYVDGPFLLRLEQSAQGLVVGRVEHGHLALLQVGGHVEVRRGHLAEQRVVYVPLLSQLGQHVGQPVLCPIVVRRDGGREVDGLHQQRVDVLGEVGGAALHAVQEGRLAQPLGGHSPYLRSPFLGYLHHLLAQRGVSLVVQLHEVAVRAHEKLGHESYHRLFGLEERVEVEELQQQVALVLLAQQRQLGDALLRGLLLMGYVALHALVVDDGAGLYGRGQEEAFQRATAAQGDVDLSRGERLGSVDDDVVERQALALVDGDGPGQAQGQLAEGALHVGLDGARLGVDGVAGVFPLQRLYLDRLRVAFAQHEHLVLVDVGNVAYTAVVVAVTARRVVLDEHHLCPHLEHHRGRRGEEIFGEGAVDLGVEPEEFSAQACQVALVVVVGQLVVGGEAYERQPCGRLHTSLPQQLQGMGRGVAVANVVEYVEEGGVLLAVDLLQLDGDVVGLLKGV